jgi:serine/threonine protein kinase
MSKERENLRLPDGTVVGRYRLHQVQAAWGFYLTYFAEETATDRQVLLHELLPEELVTRAADGQVQAKDERAAENFAWARDRFLREGRGLAACAHPAVRTILEVLEANGTAYWVTPAEEGQSLKRWLENLGRAPTEAELRALLTPLLSALQQVHGAGLLHLNLKLETIQMAPDEKPVLVHFAGARQAIARHSHAAGAATTGYSPIEQYDPDKAEGPWTDIYSLGAVLYRLIYGRVPPEATQRVQSDPYQRLAGRVSGQYSGGFLRAIDAALAPSATARPQSIEGWRKMLGIPGEQSAAPPPRRPPRLAVACAAGIALLLAAGAWQIFRPKPIPPIDDRNKDKIAAGDGQDQKAEEEKKLAEEAKKAEAERAAAEAKAAEAAEAEKKANESAEQTATTAKAAEEQAEREKAAAQQATEKAGETSDAAKKKAAAEAAEKAKEAQDVAGKAATNEAAAEVAARQAGLERATAERIAAEKTVAEKAIEARLADDVAGDKAAQAKAARDQAAADKALAEKSAAEKAAQKAKEDQAAAEKKVAEKTAAEKAAGEALVAAGAAQKTAEAKARQQKAPEDKAATEKAAAAEKAAQEIAAQKAAEEKAAAEKETNRSAQNQSTPAQAPSTGPGGQVGSGLAGVWETVEKDSSGKPVKKLIIYSDTTYDLISGGTTDSGYIKAKLGVIQLQSVTTQTSTNSTFKYKSMRLIETDGALGKFQWDRVTPNPPERVKKNGP